MANPKVLVHSVEVPMRCMRTSGASVRIAHVSDLHLRRWTRVIQIAQEHLLDATYDLLLVTGDITDTPWTWKRGIELARRFFEPFAGRTPIYAVLGNHDLPQVAEVPNLPLTFLTNESVGVEVDGHQVTIAGVQQSWHGGEDLKATLADVPTDRPSILLAHYPSTARRIPPGSVDLVLSGHTHGGQIRFPGLGCVWPHDRIPRHMARGLHSVNGAWLHVSAGLGASLPLRVRINCPPELSILTMLSDGNPACHSGSGGCATQAGAPLTDP